MPQDLISQLKAKLDAQREIIAEVDSTEVSIFNQAVSILMPVIEKLVEDRNNYLDHLGWTSDVSDQEILKILEGE
jgi:hypothetical protein